MTARFAVYFAPDPASPLGRFGARWLGRDAATNALLEQPDLAGFCAERLRAVTASPRRYGFHGTLKAPFRLAEGTHSADLHREVRAFAAGRAPIEITQPALRSLGGFWALVPAQGLPALDRLAADCVMAFEPFRAPLNAAELERRLKSPLEATQIEYLYRFGYPYIFEHFRFHLTLTERLAGEEHARIGTALAPLVEPFTQAPLVIDAVAVFEQKSADEPFIMTGRYEFGAVHSGGEAAAPCPPTA